jgi:glycerophosphoryl diester phosphodiesterase|tara:strand:- start:12 stop:299 length:288 start_codon:yes stop_codon:yes gene_type:complete
MKQTITDFQTGKTEIVELTDTEKLEVEYYNNHIAPKESIESLRIRRNQLLKESDWTQSRDVFLSNDEEWKTYRQQLRDLPKNTDPMNPVWPTKPS